MDLLNDANDNFGVDNPFLSAAEDDDPTEIIETVEDISSSSSNGNENGSSADTTIRQSPRYTHTMPSTGHSAPRIWKVFADGAACKKFHQGSL